MKKKFILISFALISFSCGVNKLVEESNKNLESIVSKNDSIITRLKKIVDNDNSIYEKESVPNFSALKVSDLKSFYHGNIMKEEILEKKGSWVKVKLTERVNTSPSQFFVKERVAWCTLNSQTVYLVANSPLTIQTATSEQDITIFNPPIDISNYSYGKDFTTKDETLSQKEIDQLLAQNALEFNGLKFVNKRFDFADFSDGAYKGTYFLNCNLTNISGVSDKTSTEYQFTETKFETGTNNKWLFKYWKFDTFMFFNMIIDNAKFYDCIFYSTSDNGIVNINNTTIKNTLFDFTNDGYIKLNSIGKSSFESCNFKNIKFYTTVHFESKYENCVFNGGLFQGVSFNNSQVPPSRFKGGILRDLKIIGGDFSRIIIEQHGMSKTMIDNTEFVNVFLNNADINAWFMNNSKIYGLGNYSSINFKNSIFENTTFGSDTPATYKANFRNCNFTGCDFRENVKFVNCDLNGATFPASIPNVQFINCIGRQ